MRHLFLASLAICVSIATMATAKADVVVRSSTVISNLLVKDANSGNTLEIGVDIAVGSSPFSFASSNLAGLNDFDIFAFDPVTSDGPLPAVTPNSVSVGGVSYTENNFSPSGVTGNYAIGDNRSDGFAVLGGPVGVPASATSYAEVGFTATGDATASSSISSKASFAPLRDITAIFEFDYQVDLEVIKDQGLLDAAATSSFTGRISGTDPAGVVDESFAPDDLQNLLVSGTTETISISGSATSQEVELLRSGTYSFSLSQSNGVDAAFVIPEPASFSSCVLIGLCGLAARRRKRR